MINTNEFGRVTVGGMVEDLFVEYENVGTAIIRSAIGAGYDETFLRAMFELGFKRVMEVLEEGGK
jgi:hypothetical protein